jgi:glycosyltransferase involved in cell wall biosynthesis
VSSEVASGIKACPADAVGFADCRCVLMVGTHATTRGGVRMVVEGYLKGGLFRRTPVTYVATHCEGSHWRKALAALAGWAGVAWQLARLDRPLVHVHVASRASFWRKSVVCLMARLARRPYLLHVHGGEFLQFYAEECGPSARWFIRRIFARAALVLALTEDWRARLARMCPQARIEVLPNGVALPPSRAPRHAARTRVLYLGVLHESKGTHDLIDAFARVASRHPEWKLVCAGDGAIAETHALAAELGISDRVECPGWLDTESKDAALAAAEIFVLPSYAEGLPMALLEAMAWGLPAIATPVGGVPNVVRDGVNGLLVAPGHTDALAESLSALMASADRRRELGAAARATIEREFSLDASLERLLRIYSGFGIAYS